MGIAAGIGCSTFDAEPSPPAPEAGAGSDAGLDTSAPLADAAPDSAPLAFCQSSDAAFCADFENGLDVGFNKDRVVNHGSLTLETIEGGAGGHALRGISEALEAGLDAADTAHGMLLVKDLTLEGARGIRLELDVRIDAVPPSVFVVVAGLDANVGSADKNSISIAFEASNGYLLVSRGEPMTSDDRYIFPLPAPRTWTHLRVDVDLQQGRLALYEDGNAAFANANGIGSSSIAVTTTIGILTLPAPSSVASVALDNLVVRRF
jgi:hypothetical protein